MTFAAKAAQATLARFSTDSIYLLYGSSQLRKKSGNYNLKKESNILISRILGIVIK